VRTLSTIACMLVCLNGCGDHGAPSAADGGHDERDAATGKPVRHDASTPARKDTAADDGGAAPPTDDDAGITQPATPGANRGDGLRGCPVHVSVVTKTYGTGDESEDDYAPRNVGAVWVTTPSGAFVRTITAWGPGYWEFAQTWLMQSQGSRVDIMTTATRSNHQRPVEANWDCRDSDLKLVAAGSYRMNFEYTEAEHQGPLLTGDRALSFELGKDAARVDREPMGFFGPISIAEALP
jgi:hypothetical protein